MLLDNLLGLASQAEGDAEAYEVAAREAVRGLVAPKGKVDPAILEREQFAAHGYAWLATYVEGLRQLLGWATRHLWRALPPEGALASQVQRNDAACADDVRFVRLPIGQRHAAPTF